MRLTSLEIENLHGTLNKKVSFFDELNLLVGINGSGKTSVLNVVDWLLRPNFPRLCTTQFSRLALDFVHNEQPIHIEAIQTPKRLDFRLMQGNTPFHPITVSLDHDPSTIRTDGNLADALDVYRSLSPEDREEPAWQLIHSFPNPVVIALDRTISAEAEGTVYTERPERYLRSQRALRASPLSKVAQVTSAQFAKYKSRLLELDAELKARMVMAALLDPDPAIVVDKTRQISRRELEDLERRLTSYLSTTLKGDDVRDQVRHFFARTRSVPRMAINAKQREFLLHFYSSQYYQLERLLDAFHTFDNKSAEAYAGLQRYLDVVNLFLRDSGKQAIFDEATNNLGFRFSGETEGPTGTALSLDHLSSGERQVLILFTFLAFIADESRLFIVDEPELSLHPKWQTEFLGAFLRLKPASTQVLLATHSPDIVGAHKASCVVLLP